MMMMLPNIENPNTFSPDCMMIMMVIAVKAIMMVPTVKSVSSPAHAMVPEKSNPGTIGHP